MNGPPARVLATRWPLAIFSLLTVIIIAVVVIVLIIIITIGLLRLAARRMQMRARSHNLELRPARDPGQICNCGDAERVIPISPHKQPLRFGD